MIVNCLAEDQTGQSNPNQQDQTLCYDGSMLDIDSFMTEFQLVCWPKENTSNSANKLNLPLLNHPQYPRKSCIYS